MDLFAFLSMLVDGDILLHYLHICKVCHLHSPSSEKSEIRIALHYCKVCIAVHHCKDALCRSCFSFADISEILKQRPNNEYSHYKSNHLSGS